MRYDLTERRAATWSPLKRAARPPPDTRWERGEERGGRQREEEVEDEAERVAAWLVVWRGVGNWSELFLRLESSLGCEERQMCTVQVTQHCNNWTE